MSKPNIEQMLAEQRQSLSEIAQLAVKAGKEQATYQYRRELRQAILDLIEWCKVNKELIKQVRASNNNAIDDSSE